MVQLEVLISLSLLCVTQINSFVEENCHSFAGGSVYPQSSYVKSVDHKLQWTNAVSKLSILTFYYN